MDVIAHGDKNYIMLVFSIFQFSLSDFIYRCFRIDSTLLQLFPKNRKCEFNNFLIKNYFEHYQQISDLAWMDFRRQVKVKFEPSRIFGNELSQDSCRAGQKPCEPSQAKPNRAKSLQQMHFSLGVFCFSWFKTLIAWIRLIIVLLS